MTKKYNITIPEEIVPQIEAAAAEAGMKPTTYLSKLVGELLGFTPRPVGNPHIAELNRSKSDSSTDEK